MTPELLKTIEDFARATPDSMPVEVGNGILELVEFWRDEMVRTPKIEELTLYRRPAVTSGRLMPKWAKTISGSIYERWSDCRDSRLSLVGRCGSPLGVGFVCAENWPVKGTKLSLELRQLSLTEVRSLNADACGLCSDLLIDFAGLGSEPSHPINETRNWRDLVDKFEVKHEDDGWVHRSGMNPDGILAFYHEVEVPLDALGLSSDLTHIDQITIRPKHIEKGRPVFVAIRRLALMGVR